jgi:tRNA (guanine10-N2)-dimethyltransferase
MHILVEFSGEHPAMPKAEFEAVLEGEGIKYSFKESIGKNAVVEIEGDDVSFLSRLALTQKAAEYAGTFSDLKEAAEALTKKINKKETIAVRSPSMSLEQKLGAELFNLGYKVNLRKPDKKIVGIKSSKEYVIGIEIPMHRTFQSRRPQFRPYFHPTSMNPKLGRTLVNLAKIKPGDKVLDPFCGTGGILIEAGLSGMKLFGSDLNKKSVKGTIGNLAHYNLKGEIKELDALKLSAGFQTTFDAVVTDPPYARSSFASEKDLKGFYEKFLLSAWKVLKKNGRVVFMIPEEYDISFGEFILINEFRMRVHKSLTRRLIVLEMQDS